MMAKKNPFTDMVPQRRGKAKKQGKGGFENALRNARASKIASPSPSVTPTGMSLTATPNSSLTATPNRSLTATPDRSLTATPNRSLTATPARSLLSKRR